MRKVLAGAIAVAALVIAVFELPHLHAHTTTHEWQTPLPVVVLGVLIGLTYGLLAVGLVLIYRTNRIVNFAHGQIGAFAAAVFGIFVLRWHVPYWLGLPMALAVGGLVAGVAEVAVIRRLRNAPRLMSVVATLGVGQFLITFAVAINSRSLGAVYPSPPFLPSVEFGALKINQAYFGMLILAPLTIIFLAWFLQRSRYGLGIRSSAANPAAARLSGVFATRMSTLAWVIAGILSALTAILTQPTQGYTDPQSFGPSLLLLALTGAVVARMRSLPVAFAAGIGIGVIQQLLLWNFPEGGLVELILFLIIIAVLLVQPGVEGREEEKGSWAAVQSLRPVPDHLRGAWAVRNLGPMVTVVGVGIAALVPLFVTNTTSVTLTTILAFAVVGLSVTIVTGLGGQLTLGQFAVAGVGAVISFVVSRSTGNYVLAFVYAGCAGALTSVVIGLPALRIRGLLLTVSTLSFALMVPDWLLKQRWMLGGGVNPGRPRVNGHLLTSGHSYYYVGLLVFVVTLVLARNVTRGGFARRLIAVRDNEPAARAFTVGSSAVKVQAFIIAGFIAGVGGAMYGHALSLIGAGSFPTTSSIDVVVMAVIGGVSMLSGALLGAAVVIGIPAFVPLDSAGLAATALGQLLIILYIPRGIAQLVEPVRDRIVSRLGKPVPRNPAAHPTSGKKTQSGVLLSATHLSKRFGGVVAVDDVSLRLRANEILGLIGPNGAGKTTTFELLSGFSRPDAGAVRFAGENVTWMSPEQRGRLGLVRSFQDAALFPTMTVLDAVQLSLERVDPTKLLREVAGWGGQDRRKVERARDLVASMGLDDYRDAPIRALSTGTRRIAELTCLIGLEPTVFLLDEPSSGIAQRETEALGELLLRLRREMGVSMVIIEHDIPLIMGLSDRIVAMDVGRVIASGPPDVVRHDPAVVDAYLGASTTAINRSQGVTT